MRSLRPRNRADWLRIGAAAVLVVGGVAIGLALGGGGHSAPAASAPPAPVQAPASVTPSSANAAAVSAALQHGSMNVVVDQPAEAAFGEENHVIEQGAQIAAEEANASNQLPGHLHIKLVPERLDGLSASAVQERLRGDGAGVLVLPCDTSSQASIANAAAHYGTLMIAACNDEPLAAQRYSSYWPVGSSASEEMAELAAFLQTQGYLRAYVVTAPGVRYAELLSGDFEKAAKAKNIRIVGSSSVNPNSEDFASVANAIKGVEPQPTAVFTALPPPAANRLGAALHAQGVQAAVVGTSVMDSRFTLASGEGLENAIFSSYGFAREGSAAEHFASDYAKQYGRPPLGSLPGLGYETVRLLEEAARRAHSGEPSAIQHVLAAGFALSGVALGDRHYQPGANHNPVSEVGVEKISGKSFEPLIAGSPSGAPGA
jgi:ABC-type branched-subunit amino acid transport system substrate-binding protein